MARRGGCGRRFRVSSCMCPALSSCTYGGVSLITTFVFLLRTAMHLLSGTCIEIRCYSGSPFETLPDCHGLTQTPPSLNAGLMHNDIPPRPRQSIWKLSLFFCSRGSWSSSVPDAFADTKACLSPPQSRHIAVTLESVSPSSRSSPLHVEWRESLAIAASGPGHSPVIHMFQKLPYPRSCVPLCAERMNKKSRYVILLHHVRVSWST